MTHEQLRPLRWIASLAFIPFAWACGNSDDRAPPLVERRSPLADATEVSELLGFSLEQVMPSGVHAATLTWNENRSGIDFSPTMAVTPLRWSLALPERGSEWFRIEQVEVDCDRMRFITNVDSLCEDRLEAGLLMHLESADGALAEDIPVSFEAQSANDVSWLNRQLDVGQFAGGFSISASAGDPSSLRLGVFAGVSDGDLSGALIGDIVTERSNKGGATLTQGAVVTVAEWRDSALVSGQK